MKESSAIVFQNQEICPTDFFDKKIIFENNDFAT
jgi:hypothetical protein